ncbi:MAG: 16S rRNA (uracil(1498)-N(3))-methyltransferase [Chloroflexi bacterium]|nr:16S rRNA (uracil(1498)-N(3))-methyltransferase [Chloroflexota bacterium]
MRRFHTAGVTSDSADISDAEQLHYLRDVLRLKPADEVVLFDDEGNEYTCRITGLSRKRAVLAVREKRAAPRSKTGLAVACAIPKGNRMDDVVDSLTQLGADKVIPMLTARVVAKLDSAREAAKHDRWLKIARSAARQSQRSLPEIMPVTTFEAVLALSGQYDLKLIPALVADGEPIRAALAGFLGGRVLVLIGPEGDFTPAEVDAAREAGFIPVSLGDTVLRVATAAVAAASFIRLWLAGR